MQIESTFAQIQEESHSQDEVLIGTPFRCVHRSQLCMYLHKKFIMSDKGRYYVNAESSDIEQELDSQDYPDIQVMDSIVPDDIIMQKYNKYPVWEVIDILNKINIYFGGVKNLFEAFYDHIKIKQCEILKNNNSSFLSVSSVLETALNTFSDIVKDGEWSCTRKERLQFLAMTTESACDENGYDILACVSCLWHGFPFWTKRQALGFCVDYCDEGIKNKNLDFCSMVKNVICSCVIPYFDRFDKMTEDLIVCRPLAIALSSYGAFGNSIQFGSIVHNKQPDNVKSWSIYSASHTKSAKKILTAFINHHVIFDSRIHYFTRNLVDNHITYDTINYDDVCSDTRKSVKSIFHYSDQKDTSFEAFSLGAKDDSLHVKELDRRMKGKFINRASNDKYAFQQVFKLDSLIGEQGISTITGLLEQIDLYDSTICFCMAHLRKTRINSDGLLVNELCMGGLTDYLIKLYLMCKVEVIEQRYRQLLKYRCPETDRYHFEAKEKTHQQIAERIQGQETIFSVLYDPTFMTLTISLPLFDINDDQFICDLKEILLMAVEQSVI